MSVSDNVSSDTRLSAGDTGLDKTINNKDHPDPLQDPKSETNKTLVDQPTAKPATPAKSADLSKGDPASDNANKEFEFDRTELSRETIKQIGPAITSPEDGTGTGGKPWFTYLRIDDRCCNEFTASWHQLRRQWRADRLIPRTAISYFDPRCHGSFAWYLSCIFVLTFALSVALRLSGGRISVYPLHHYMAANSPIFSGKKESLDGSKPASPVSCILNKLTQRGNVDEAFLMDGSGDVVASSQGVVTSMVEATGEIITALADFEGEVVDVSVQDSVYSCMMCPETKTIVCKSGPSVIFVLRNPNQSRTLVGLSHLKDYENSFSELRRLFAIFGYKKFEPYLQ